MTNWMSDRNYNKYKSLENHSMLLNKQLRRRKRNRMSTGGLANKFKFSDDQCDGLKLLRLKLPKIDEG